MFKLIDNFITKEQCEDILNYSLTNLDLREAKIITENGAKFDNHRKSKIAFDRYEKFEFLNKKIMNFVLDDISINGYKIEFTDKGYQFTTYKPGEYYNWHNDSSDQRYYSVVIQLNDDYIGGTLELVTENKVVELKNGTGNGLIFLSEMNHRVTEVIKGVRYSLVCWLKLIPIENHKKSII